MNQLAVQSMPRTQRLGAIDVGTNSIRLVVAEASADGTYRLLDDEKEVTRLGQGLARTGRLAPQAMKQSAEAVARMKEIAEGYGVMQLRIVATSAVRDAANGYEFLDLVRSDLGLAVDVITAEEEAKLAFTSVQNAFDLRPLDAAVVDIGGGSTEIVLASGGEVQEIHTLPLGAVRLTDQFGEEIGPEKRRRVMRRAVRDLIRAQIGRTDFSPRVMFGTGGTFTALANISFQRHLVGSGSSASRSHPFTVRGYEMDRREVRQIYDWLSSMSLRSRMRIPGLSPDRAEIIVAGAAIVERLMRHFKVDLLRVHDRGIRDGLILTMIGQVFPHARGPLASGVLGPPDRMQLVKQFAVACNDDRHHSEHVTELSLQIYDQLIVQLDAQTERWAQPEARELLCAAANLHDIGYSINYARHHKHSYHLIIHSELGGFTHRELEVVANIARYHRRADPKIKHDNFAKLNGDDRELVRRLSAILRIADGLDRAHAQFVKHVSVEMRNGTIWFLIHADADPVVDIWGAARKSQLFQKSFGLDARFEWTGDGKDADREARFHAQTSGK
ncbi:MAG TPA: Ppx/GppA phosphatase family protein [Phycisphaerales bacterium]|nr:Ppx/GppA phosphatase family protein [Phycisphaerales bacterium]HRQ74310.1 Ppx/GppA phosphatase family protein [Phycisphaerales bacterium]